MKLAILCGGPSPERGISLNSARSVLDHLAGAGIEIIPVYFDWRKRSYQISKPQLYSNTPSDFDFKLSESGVLLSPAGLVKLLRGVDLVFPLMHGAFGEDGGIQSFLERRNLPFVGSSSAACKRCFDKFTANEYIRRHGFFVLPSAVLKIHHADHRRLIEDFFAANRLHRAVVKPASGGSSVGVFSVSTPAEAAAAVKTLFSKRMDTRVVIEPFAAGVEFTVIILENRRGQPVAILPTEIETDYDRHQFFDFRKKYLPTRQVVYHCPPRFSDEVVERIQKQAEQLFALFGMRDFSRFDGWVLPDGRIWFSDFNPVSGMEQNSFLFLQAARTGLSHNGVLRHIIARACQRHGVVFPPGDWQKVYARRPVNVLFGGKTSERQVSLLSGTNVWLKLRHSRKYLPRPYLLDPKGVVWRLSYPLALNHTVEEIAANCRDYPRIRARLEKFQKRARLRLGFEGTPDLDDFGPPLKMSLKQFIARSGFVFIALHGGSGENGTLQRKLSRAGAKFNGSGELVSRLCLDKWAAGRFIRGLGLTGIDTAAGKLASVRGLFTLRDRGLQFFWRKTRRELEARTLVVKPRADGCSTGVVHLVSSRDLISYLRFLKSRAAAIPKGVFKGQFDPIELPAGLPADLIFEKFVETDVLQVKGGKLIHRRRSGWLEATVGVLDVRGRLRVFRPSVTVISGKVLTVEEKFQGGTGINITPPPQALLQAPILVLIRKRIRSLALKIGVRGYARFDVFIHLETGRILVIEVNTLPGLTPATVFFHQALAESPAIPPRELLEKIVAAGGY